MYLIDGRFHLIKFWWLINDLTIILGGDVFDEDVITRKKQNFRWDFMAEEKR